MEKITIICSIISIILLILPLIINIILVLKRRVVYEITYIPEHREFHIYKNNEKIGNTLDIETARELVKKDNEKDPYDKYKSVQIKIKYTENL